MTHTIKFSLGKCPTCGEILYLDNTRNNGFCIYCGASLLVDQALRLYNPQSDPTTQIEHLQEKENLLLRAEQILQFLQQNSGKDFSRAISCYEKLLDCYDPRCAVAWWNLFKLTCCNNFNPDLFLPSNAKFITERNFSYLLTSLKNHLYYKYAFAYGSEIEQNHFTREFSNFTSQCQDYYSRSMIRQLQEDYWDNLIGSWYKEDKKGFNYIQFWSNHVCNYLIAGNISDHLFFYSKIYYHQPVKSDEKPYFELVKPISGFSTFGKLSIHPLSTNRNLILNGTPYQRSPENLDVSSPRLKLLQIWIHLLLWLN